MEKINPMDIEKRSFEIISSELNGIVLDEEKAPIVKRVIHTTADFEYVDNMYFSEGVVEKALEALKRGAAIVTDTNMAKSGINKAAAARLGCEVHCFMADEDVAKSPSPDLSLTHFQALAHPSSFTQIHYPIHYPIPKLPPTPAPHPNPNTKCHLTLETSLLVQ